MIVSLKSLYVYRWARRLLSIKDKGFECEFLLQNDFLLVYAYNHQKVTPK